MFALHKELEYIFFGQFVKEHKIGKQLRWPEFDKWDENFKMSSIEDETHASQTYFDEISLAKANYGVTHR